MTKPWKAWGYTKKDYKRWGRLGGRPVKYYSNNPSAEAAKAYRRRKAGAKLISGERTGFLNLRTGRIKNYANNAERQQAYRLRKKLTETFK